VRKYRTAYKLPRQPKAKGFLSKKFVIMTPTETEILNAICEPFEKEEFKKVMFAKACNPNPTPTQQRVTNGVLCLWDEYLSETDIDNFCNVVDIMADYFLQNVNNSYILSPFVTMDAPQFVNTKAFVSTFLRNVSKLNLLYMLEYDRQQAQRKESNGAKK
jgi:hypothetical protein